MPFDAREREAALTSPALERLRTIHRALDAVSERTGKAVAWLSLAMVLVIGWDVAMRYLFNRGSVALQEMEWHLFALLFLLSAAYTLKHNDHVRVDILYNTKMSPRGRAWVDLFGTLFFLVPFSLLIIKSSWPFVCNAYLAGEGSPDPGGLPYRFVLKAAIPAGFALVLVQGISEIAKLLHFLLRREPEAN